MNRSKKWIALLTVIAVVGVLALSACGEKKEPAQQAGGGSAPTGSSQVATPPAADPTGIAGEYKLYAVGQGDTFYSAEEYAEFMQQLMGGLTESFGADEGTKNEIQNAVDFSNSVLAIRDDNSATITLFGMSAECTWTEKDGAIEFAVTAAEEGDNSTISNGETMKATFDAGLIRLNDPDSGSEMIFATEGADTSGIKISSMKDALNSLGK